MPPMRKEDSPPVTAETSKHEMLPIQDRALQLSLSRTAYNYMRTYPNLDAVPLCASVPAAESFTADYNALILKSGLQITDNFLRVARRILEAELSRDAGLLTLPKLIADIEAAATGLTEAFTEGLAEGPTAFLKSTLYDLLRRPVTDAEDLLRATSEEDYARLIDTLPTPLMLALDQAEWMPKQAPGAPRRLPCEQDWFFGYLQVAGFNTTNLRGVVSKAKAGSKAVVWSDLQMAFNDQMLQEVLGDKTKTLEQAIQDGALYVCNYSALIGDGDLDGKESYLHGKRRYLPSPVALFYWNQKPPHGYPPGYRGDGSKTDGVLQPIAIQLAPAGTRGATIFTPNDCSGANDPAGWKWQIAKFFVNVACAIQHESVAHLGDCHFIVESIAVATHRQLAQQHPVFELLAPHLRFTLSINSGALSNLIVPGGVVATNVGPNIHWTLEMVNEARKAWRWDENNPERIFGLRGVDVDRPLAFPFRDDTLLLWKATKGFVNRYVNLHYRDDSAVIEDRELRAWFDELTSPQHAAFQGLNRPTTRGELAEVVAQIIYIAGPLHASLNYAQYPLGAYMPSVAATIYKPAPTSDTQVDDQTYLEWFPPLDVALYTLSFEYLLSSVQYDRFGHYAENAQFAHFADSAVQEALENFQGELASAEMEIQGRNRRRPMPYPFQLPSRIPNSISI
jgi:arachidonate 15-lipoxygenase